MNTKPITFSFLNDSAFDPGFGHSTLHCPVCGFGYVHERDPYVVPGGDDYKAGWEGRGDLTVLGFDCENGHHFELCFGFHKGNIHAFVRSLHTLPAMLPDN